MLSESLSTGFQTTLTGSPREAVGDRLRLLGDLAQGLLAVEVLAAGDEPDLVAVERGGQGGAGHGVSLVVGGLVSEIGCGALGDSDGASGTWAAGQRASTAARSTARPAR